MSGLGCSRCQPLEPGAAGAIASGGLPVDLHGMHALAVAQVEEEGWLEREAAQQDIAVLDAHAPYRRNLAQQRAIVELVEDRLGDRQQALPERGQAGGVRAAPGGEVTPHRGDVAALTLGNVADVLLD